MKKKFITVYGVAAFIILFGAVLWFIFSVSTESRKGKVEADRSFSWIAREAVTTALSDGFMSNAFIQKLTDICHQSRLLSAVVISTPSGAVFAWPEKSRSIQYDLYGKPQIADASPFMKVYSTSLDIGDGTTGAVVITAVMYVLHPDDVYNASRNSFFVILALLLATFIVIFAQSSVATSKDTPSYERGFVEDDPSIEAISLTTAHEAEVTGETTVTEEPDVAVIDETSGTSLPDLENKIDLDATNEIVDEKSKTESTEVSSSSGPLSKGPEGLFSPVTGTGWEQYLTERLDAELIRAASSEQDLSLMVIRVSNLLHTDLLARKIAQMLLDTFKFRDLIFEFGSNGFAAILQNVNLDQAMKTANELYADIDTLLIDMPFDGHITIGITTRTARLIPATRIIEEAVNAARKAEEEPSLPIVAFRANPEKYRDFVAENG